MSDTELLPTQQSEDGITFGMDNYQHCKSVAKPYDGPDDTIEDQQSYIMDMVYWENYLLASGAISLQACAMGPNWMSSEQAWYDQMDEASKNCLVMNAKGSPIMGYVGTIPA